MAAGITPGQKAFRDAIEEEFNKQFSSQLDGNFSAMHVPNGFYWGIQFGPNGFYNENALKQMDSTVTKSNHDILTLEDTSFSTMYSNIVDEIIYAFSDQDQKILDDEAKNNQSKIQAVIDTWETDKGAIPPKELRRQQSKMGYIEDQVQQLWNGDISKIPSYMTNFKIAYQNYILSCVKSTKLYDHSAKAIARLNAAVNNSTNPDHKNGGLQIGKKDYFQAYGPFPAQSAINSSLQTESNKATIRLNLSNFQSKDTKLSIGGKAGFDIPVADILNIGVTAGGSYTLDKYASKGTDVTVNIIYPGVTFIGVPITAGRLESNNSEGWYDVDILSKAINNRNGDDTGYQLQSSDYPDKDYFGKGKKFGRIKTWVIGQQPTIELEFKAAEVDKIKKDFKENASVNAKLFGMFDIGSLSQDYEIQEVKTDSAKGSATLKLGPSKPTGIIPVEKKTAYVIGGVASYPPNDA